MTLKIGRLEYEKGEIIVPGDIMRDQGFKSLKYSYDLLEEIKKENKIEIIYIQACTNTLEIIIYEKREEIPYSCELCGKEDNVIKNCVVGYRVV